jgi:predicted RNA binding protein YcfA (HicA-like mRNA interferase family)
MPRPMKVRDIIKLIEADGWYLVRIRGSHQHFHHPTKRGTVTVAGKPSQDLHPDIVKSILRQAQL